MERFCYTLTIRQRTCQNGIARNTENIYTNVLPGNIINLSFGYTVTFISASATSATIQISNPNFIPNLIFTIPNGGFKIFDLPKENGTLQVYIAATCICCDDTVVCCN